MKRLTLILLFLLTGCALHSPKIQPITAPVSAVQIVRGSVARLTLETSGGTYTCTAWSLAPRKFVTAAHCTDALEMYPDGRLMLDGRPAFILKEDDVTDLAILIADLVKPGLDIRTVVLDIGESVTAMGFGYGFTAPLLTRHTVQILNYTISPEIYPGTIFMGGFIGGMSGGPVFDINGDVVGVVQRGTEQIGYGVNTATLLEFLMEAS